VLYLTRQESGTGLPSDAVLSNCFSKRGFLVLPEELTQICLKLLFSAVLQGRPVMSCQVSPLELFFQQGIDLLIPQRLWFLILIVPEHRAYRGMLTLAIKSQHVYDYAVVIPGRSDVNGEY